MELEITRFFNEATPKDYSASVAEIGQNAGPDTWRAACDDSEEYLILDSEEKREDFRQHIAGFGAWDDEEINAMSDKELNALCIQLISGDIREAGLNTTNPDWPQYQLDSEAGQVSGNLFAADGKIYYSLD